MNFQHIPNDFSTRYQIVETKDGLMISDTFNLTPLQVQTAIDYIEAHRATREPQLVKAIQLREEREHYYRAIQKEIWDKIAKEPMTPQRAAFYALRDKHLREIEAESDAAYS